MAAMSDPYVAFAAFVGGVNVLAAVAGLAQWALGRPSPLFWFLARSGQVVAAAYAVFAGIYALTGKPPVEGLAWVYILTPIAVSYFAEQLRLVAAQTVLERHGFESASALRASVHEAGTGDSGAPDSEDRQRLVTGIAHEVVLREVAVVATAAFVIAFLAWRAWLIG